MPFSIIQNDLLQMKTDAIVNTTNRYYSGGGGVDYLIHQAAGPELFEACGYLGRLHLGEAKATPGYNLPVKYIIHTSGPQWTGGSSADLSFLDDCYKNSIELAREKKCQSIAFPLISSKRNGFPKEVALTVAVNAIRDALKYDDTIDVYLVIYGENKALPNNLLSEIQLIIENEYKPNNSYMLKAITSPPEGLESIQSMNISSEEDVKEPSNIEEKEDLIAPSEDDEAIETLINELLNHPIPKILAKVPIGESFAIKLAKILENRKLKHSKIYDEIGMTSVGFWKLLKGKSNPSKMTVFGLAIVLQLPIEDVKEMLMRAGYAINPSSLQDVIISGLIKNKIYDKFVIDELLYALDLQVLPGAIID